MLVLSSFLTPISATSVTIKQVGVVELGDFLFDVAIDRKVKGLGLEDYLKIEYRSHIIRIIIHC